MKIQFDATPEGNVLHSADNSVFAIVPVPDGASDDYGYIALKNAILAAYAGSEPLEFWYDGQEDFLAEDASCGTPRVEIDEVIRND